jgi:DUF3037 family protein
VPALCSYDYAIIRVVPRVEREEFLNVGVILSCATHEFLDARIAVDPTRLRALDPTLDDTTLAQHLDSIRVICRGGPEALALGALTTRERFHWLVAPRSTMIQTSPVHSGHCLDPDVTLESLVRTMVLPAAAKR